MEFKIGDKVKIIQRKTGNTTGNQKFDKTNGDVDSIGFITETNNNGYRYCVEDGIKYYGLFDKDDLELVTDKQEDLTGRWLKALVNCPQSTDCKKDEYVRIKSMRSDTSASGYTVVLDDEFSFGATPSEKDLWELMPEGFDPDNQYINGIWYIVTDSHNKDSVIKYDRTEEAGHIYFYEGFNNSKEYTWGTGNWCFSSCTLKPFDISEYSHLFPKTHELYKPIVKEPTFEVGKWYKYSPWYLKLDYVNDSNVFVACETIDCNGRYGNRDGEYFTCGEANHTKTLLTDLSEIQQYLPDGHVDKVQAIPEYVKCTVTWMSNHTLGTIYKVYKDGDVENNHKESSDLTWDGGGFEPSTKEDYDAQQDPNVFKAGTYIVLLASCDGKDCWKSSIPINHCYILKRDSHSLDIHIKLDAQGSTINGWSSSSFYDSKMKIRAATPEEIAEYDRLGKPYDVTTLGKKDSIEDILEEAKRRYPVGTILKCLVLNKSVKVTSHNTELLNKVDQIYFQVEGNHTLVYSEGKWAEIVTPVVEPKAAKYIPKVGDWVITEGYSDNYDGKPLKINKINDGIYCFFDEVNFYEHYSKSHNFHIDKAIRKAEPHEILQTLPMAKLENEYTPEEALAELKRRGFKKGVKYVYMYENGTYDEKDIRTANYEPCISGTQYIDCGGGYLWSKENPSHLHRGPVLNPCDKIPLTVPQVSLWGEPATSTPNYLDPASLLKKVQLPI